MVLNIVDRVIVALSIFLRWQLMIMFDVFFYFSKGISQSALPYRRSVPSWLKLNAEDVKEQIKKLGKKGMTPSQIGK